ncbi:hypothetical protein GS919_03320 [Rhodococcus hoagii]|nr:hypothetical protein [Prescottella equi]
MTNTENITASAPVARGLLLSVLRNADGRDCTLGGISSRATALTLVGTLDSRKGQVQRVTAMPARSRCVEPTAARPAVALEIRTGLLAEDRYISLVPVEWDDEIDATPRTHSWSMAGGNYATTSDSRFPELVRYYVDAYSSAVAIHDRVEN